MASTEISVEVRDLSVSYRVYEEASLDLGQLARRGFRSRSKTTVQALQDVSFDVHVGEAVGIVGSNGSGKSTLLRTIAGLQKRQTGTVLVRGNAHLLGVNAALQKSLSGYRNVTLGGLAMGMSRAEIDAAMPRVEEFSGLSEAMGRPMDTYSSGMKARLAFSIATLQVPDILLIDEALAVGDKNFRKRSLARINEIRDQANAVLMVTHNLKEIRETCSRTIWLDGGRLVADGPVDEVLDLYEQRDA